MDASLQHFEFVPCQQNTTTASIEIQVVLPPNLCTVQPHLALLCGYNAVLRSAGDTLDLLPLQPKEFHY